MDSKKFRRSRKILTLEQKVKSLEIYDNKTSRTVGEAYGVNKDQIQKLLKLRVDVFGEYSGNARSHSRCIRRKNGN